MSSITVLHHCYVLNSQMLFIQSSRGRQNVTQHILKSSNYRNLIPMTTWTAVQCYVFISELIWQNNPNSKSSSSATFNCLTRPLCQRHLCDTSEGASHRRRPCHAVKRTRNSHWVDLGNSAVNPITKVKNFGIKSKSVVLNFLAV